MGERRCQGWSPGSWLGRWVEEPFMGRIGEDSDLQGELISLDLFMRVCDAFEAPTRHRDGAGPRSAGLRQMT